ncbi:MAG: GTPase ObgE [Candidatus Yonathbacteria bacterium CG_4_9_14_0_8_um_filter_46_47]|uniref:GTPase Obg n=1 Tax=Candidatus Yonathbacteria bacterium CG_4_9_14_0_8_um_filter_46_47 TaxID=1975106 RepID=A0A2M8DA05_9BACT|nr:MAG: GTPase ObgE [Candidatus Yonathbacteria bacterium CG_4_9_14_0_8_um_filter_46_47]
MAFIDELNIFACAGKGGNGVARWRHQKGKEFGGPAGGNGGRGGDVHVLAVRDVQLLSKYRTIKEFCAQDGGDGGKNSLHGSDGENLDIALPLGSIITNIKTNKRISFQKEGELILLLRGGNGGRGNESFKSSINRSPKETTPGTEGEQGEFFVEVELIADIGLIGLPNAGKTSLLNMLTSAKGQVGNYPFTTLEPNLGEFNGYIISDIPGLIEGAANGKGLGHKFLRHVKRTKILAHVISLENEDLIEAYETIRHELEEYGNELPLKKEIIVLTKTDMVDDPARIKKAVNEMKKRSEVVLTVSLYDDEAVKMLKLVFLQKIK